MTQFSDLTDDIWFCFVYKSIIVLNIYSIVYIRSFFIWKSWGFSPATYHFCWFYFILNYFFMWLYYIEFTIKITLFIRIHLMQLRTFFFILALYLFLLISPRRSFHFISFSLVDWLSLLFCVCVLFCFWLG